MKPTACQLTIPEAPTHVRSELHNNCGLEWMEMNLAFENGKPLDLHFSFDPDALEKTVRIVRAIVDIAHRNQLDVELSLSNEAGVLVLATYDEVENVFSQSRTNIDGPPIVQPCTDLREVLEGSINRHRLQAWSKAILELVMPCLAFRTPLLVSHDNELELGCTKLWGMPDLPIDMPWPQQKDCTAIWPFDVGHDPAGHCDFVGQVRLSDLSGTHASGLLPDSGLLSIFVYESEDSGSTDVCLLLTDEAQELERKSPPQTLQQVTYIRAPVAVEIVERAALPETDGPHFQPLRDQGIDEASYAQLINELDTRGLGLLGYGFTPTAGDVTASTAIQQLLRLETPEGQRIDLQLLKADLAAGRFERAKLVYAHFD